MKRLVLIVALLFLPVMAWAQDDILASLRSLDEASQALEASREILERNDLSNIPTGRPCEGKLVSPFGYRADPFTGRIKHHNGVDITNKTGTPIMATGGGTVVFAGRGWHRGYTGYGRVVVIAHSDRVVTLYGHLSEIRVTVGDHVSRGSVIGLMGSTGRSTGSHLHYEIRVSGRPVDPEEWM